MNQPKKITVLLLLVSALCVQARAETRYNNDNQNIDVKGRHTYTLGYARSHIKGFTDMEGLNVKYHYEIPELPLGAMISVSWMNGRGEQLSHFSGGSETKHHSVRYYSLMIGPTARVTQWASLWLLAGAGFESSTNRTVFHSPEEEHSGRYKIFDARFAWGTGVQFNPLDNLAFDVGFQAGHILKTSSNGFNVGMGYRF